MKKIETKENKIKRLNIEKRVKYFDYSVKEDMINENGYDIKEYEIEKVLRKKTKWNEEYIAYLYIIKKNGKTIFYSPMEKKVYENGSVFLKFKDHFSNIKDHL